MTVEFRHDPNIMGAVKEIAVALCPGLYTRARGIRDRLAVALEQRCSPYVSQKEIGSIPFAVWVCNTRERITVDGVCFESELIEDMVRCIKPGDTIFDIGSATGTHAIPAALKAGRNGVVWTFEPDEECAMGLQENLALNGLKNVRIMPVALWREDCQLILHTSGRSGTAAQVGELGGSGVNDFSRQDEVTARRIDSLVEKGSMKAPDIIKIDVEGAGEAVLEGLGSLRPRHIFMEIHPLLGENRDGIMEFLQHKGYKIVSESPRGGEIHVHFALS